jgi:tight adherence protein B
VPLLLALAGAAALLLPTRRLPLAVIVLLGAWGTGRLAARRRRAALAARRRQAVSDYGEALLGELLAGQPVLRAAERAALVWPEAEPVAAAARLGADVPGALRALARRPGAEALRRLAAAWTVCEQTGAGLAFAVEQVLQTARSEQAVSRMVDGEVASALATARLVTVLPVVVLVAAQGIGGRPWEFLLGTVPGQLCLSSGLALALAGLRWIDRIAEDARGGVL